MPALWLLNNLHKKVQCCSRSLSPNSAERAVHHQIFTDAQHRSPEFQSADFDGKYGILCVIYTCLVRMWSITHRIFYPLNDGSVLENCGTFGCGGWLVELIFPQQVLIEIPNLQGQVWMLLPRSVTMWGTLPFSCHHGTTIPCLLCQMCAMRNSEPNPNPFSVEWVFTKYFVPQ